MVDISSNTEYQRMNEVSARYMDLLVNKPGFPDFAFVLHGNGWLTHHIIAERSTIRTSKGTLTGARRKNYGASRTGDFNQYYVEKVFDAIASLKSERQPPLNIDEIAVIPLDDREKEILSLGKIVATEDLQAGVKVKTVEFQGQEGKRIKIYSAPQLRLDGMLGMG